MTHQSKTLTTQLKVLPKEDITDDVFLQLPQNQSAVLVPQTALTQKNTKFLKILVVLFPNSFIKSFTNSKSEGDTDVTGDI